MFANFFRKLGLGGSQRLPPNWGSAARVYDARTKTYFQGGTIWWGKEPPSAANIAELRTRAAGRALAVDENTLAGTNDPSWTTEGDLKKAEIAAALPWYHFRRPRRYRKKK